MATDAAKLVEMTPEDYNAALACAAVGNEMAQKLTREIDRLRALLADARRELDALRARVAALEAGLEPFAIYGQQLPERYQYEFETVLLEATPGPNITVGDVRRAATLLTEART